MGAREGEAIMSVAECGARVEVRRKRRAAAGRRQGLPAAAHGAATCPMQQRRRRYRAAAIRARVLKPPDERERAVEIVFVGARSPTSSTQSVGMAWG